MLTVAKTVSSVGVHVLVASGVGYAMTGSLAIGGAVALVEPIANMVVHRLHEKVWSRWSRK